MREVEEEAQRGGPQAVAEVRAFDAHFNLAAEISRIEGGRANPTVSTLSALAATHGGELGIRIRPSIRASRTVHAAGDRRSAQPRLGTTEER
jgi:hypothetical protein